MSFFKDLLDGGAASAQKANEKNAAILSATLGQQYGAGANYLDKGLATLDSSYAAQKQSIAQYGQQASNQIVEGGVAQNAANNQSLVGKGLYNTSVAQNMAQQTQGGVNTALASLGQNLGLMNANVEAQYGAQKNAAYQNFAQYAMSKVGAKNAITPQYQASGGGLLSGLGTIAGAALGGPLGAALGGMLGGATQPQQQTPEKGQGVLDIGGA